MNTQWFVTAAVFLTAANAIGSQAIGRELTFEDRVRAQDAIERVYYSHQIGVTKPFEEVVPRAVLEKKVTAYLRESVALDTLWHAPVTAETLRRELDRIARDTRLPERLQEIYAALGNDVFLIEECFARPAVVDRLARSFHGNPSTWESSWSGASQKLDPSTVRPVAASRELRQPAAACPAADTWTRIAQANAPSVQSSPVSVWTGNVMIVWGGATGGRYDPLIDAWTPTSTTNAPVTGTGRTVVWTGNGDGRVGWRRCQPRHDQCGRSLQPHHGHMAADKSGERPVAQDLPSRGLDRLQDDRLGRLVECHRRSQPSVGRTLRSGQQLLAADGDRRRPAVSRASRAGLDRHTYGGLGWTAEALFFLVLRRARSATVPATIRPQTHGRPSPRRVLRRRASRWGLGPGRT
jgi:hypothetical protein